MFISFKISVIVVIVTFLLSCSGSYLQEGVNLKYYKTREVIPIQVNKISSTVTQLPYRYYDLEGICKPKKEQHKKENLGEILRGDRIENSVYEVKALEEVDCRVINFLPTVANSDSCTYQSSNNLQQFTNKINDNYIVEWVMDNLPSATAIHFINTENMRKRYEYGFRLGMKDYEDSSIVINNHLNINVVYGTNQNDSIYILGFEISPDSREYNIAQWELTEDKTKCPLSSPHNFLKIENNDNNNNNNNNNNQTILWTYSVSWEQNSNSWNSRWNPYWEYSNSSIHFMSICNSLVIVLLLAGAVVMIMRRIMNDIKKYTFQNLSEDVREVPWIAVQGDVFRPPSYPLFLSILIGSGAQVYATVIAICVISMFGFLTSAQRGMLITVGLILFCIMGFVAGFVSTIYYKTFKGTDWKKCATFTSFAFPGFSLFIFFILNMVQASVKSSGAIPFGSWISLLGMWIFLEVPLVFYGSFVAQKKQLPKDPIPPNSIPKQIPKQAWYRKPTFSTILNGILPFSAVFIEFFFVLTCMWGSMFWNLFGFLLIVIVLMVLICSQTSIITCYFLLRSGDYHWWWRSFLSAGSPALYMFLYSTFYFYTSLMIDNHVSVLLYFGYSLLMATAFFVLSGTVGFCTSYYFMRKIYSDLEKSTHSAVMQI